MTKKEIESLLDVGSKIKFEEERPYYEVKALTKRFAICIRPNYKDKDAPIYSIIDFKKNIRGADNRVFCTGYTDLEHIVHNLAELEKGDLEISYRNNIPLKIEKIKEGKPLWASKEYLEREEFLKDMDN